MCSCARGVCTHVIFSSFCFVCFVVCFFLAARLFRATDPDAALSFLGGGGGAGGLGGAKVDVGRKLYPSPSAAMAFRDWSQGREAIKLFDANVFEEKISG